MVSLLLSKLKAAHLHPLPPQARPPALQAPAQVHQAPHQAAHQAPQAQRNYLNGDSLHGKTLHQQPGEIQHQLLHGTLTLLNNGILSPGTPTLILGDPHGEILLHQLGTMRISGVILKTGQLLKPSQLVGEIQLIPSLIPGKMMIEDEPRL